MQFKKRKEKKFDKIISDKSVEKVEAVVHGILRGIPIPIPFPLSNPNGCVNSGLTCPLSGGKDYKYDTTLFVRTVYPKVC